MRCSYCERRCEIAEGKTGFCRMYSMTGNGIVELYPFKWSACNTSYIESMPFYHVYPGSRCLAIGSAGCNLSCRYCSNAYIAKEEPGIQQESMYELNACELVAMARKLNCRSIVFNVNEPVVSIPSLAEVSSEARAAGILAGCLTNGYMTEESAEMFPSIFSFINVSLKGITDDFYREYTGVDTVEPVLRNIRSLAKKCFIEITTPVIEGVNDRDIDSMADFIAGIDPLIPWHVFRLLPEDEMKNEKYPDIERINNALVSARKKLPYVYFHNFVGSDHVNTVCPSCGTVVIERFSLGCGGDMLNRIHCNGSICQSCGHIINMFNENTASAPEEEVQ